MAQIAPIGQVFPLFDASSPYAVRKMKATLEKQGQIEPLQVRKVMLGWAVFHDDPWGNEIVYAARELGWTTLLVVEMLRYDVEMPKEPAGPKVQLDRKQISSGEKEDDYGV
jgi:hypothetical protein